MSVDDPNRQYEETLPDKSGKCIVCGHLTHDRTVQMRDGKVSYRHWRCGDFEPCKERRAASKKRRRSS